MLYALARSARRIRRTNFRKDAVIALPDDRLAGTPYCCRGPACFALSKVPLREKLQ
jgi:hypothetical protein